MTGGNNRAAGGTGVFWREKKSKRDYLDVAILRQVRDKEREKESELAFSHDELRNHEQKKEKKNERSIDRSIEFVLGDL